MLDYLPEGLLPKWLVIVSVAAFFNSAQCFISPFKFNREIYSKKVDEVTTLSARLFGTWTLLSGIIRLYCAYHMRDETAYKMTVVTFFLALFHFGSELLAFKTVALNRASISPFIVSSLSIVWMLNSYSSYIL